MELPNILAMRGVFCLAPLGLMRKNKSFVRLRLPIFPGVNVPRTFSAQDAAQIPLEKHWLLG